jgi:tripartite-type tricarboxylate transporter receptor subunit TctC
MTNLLAGQTRMIIERATTVLPHIAAPRVKALAVMSTEGLTGLADHGRERVFRIPAKFLDRRARADGNASGRGGRLNAAINDGLRSAEMRANFAKFGAEAKIGSPQDFATFIAAEAPIWAVLARHRPAKSSDPLRGSTQGGNSRR